MPWVRGSANSLYLFGEILFLAAAISDQAFFSTASRSKMEPLKPPVRQPSWPPDKLWEGHMERHKQLVKRSQRPEGSLPLAPPQGNPGNEIPGIRIAFMNLGGGEPGFNTNPKAQRGYQKNIIQTIGTLISGDMHVIAITGLNDVSPYVHRILPSGGNT